MTLHGGEAKRTAGCFLSTLKDCHSQGDTRVEALETIREALRLWVEDAEEDATRFADLRRRRARPTP